MTAPTPEIRDSIVLVEGTTFSHRRTARARKAAHMFGGLTFAAGRALGSAARGWFILSPHWGLLPPGAYTGARFNPAWGRQNERVRPHFSSDEEWAKTTVECLESDIEGTDSISVVLLAPTMPDFAGVPLRQAFADSPRLDLSTRFADLNEEAAAAAVFRAVSFAKDQAGD